MPTRTQIACPNCRQPVIAAIDQLFDVSANPADKQRFLAGQFNAIRCPHCGFQGMIAAPIVYHDADKELLLTFIPMELSMPVPEQERLIGRLVNRVVSNLAPEKRKGYLFNPTQVLTLQALVERVLEADGITREMLEEQSKKANLIQEFTRASEHTLPDLIREHDAEIDEAFFQILGLSASASAASGDRRSAEKLTSLQKTLLEHSSFGRELKTQQADLEAAANALQAAGDRLTQEKFLDLVIGAPNENQALALVGMARQGVDYNFFQLLTRRMEAAAGQERARLSSLREKILDLVREIDAVAEARARQAGELLKTLLQAEDPAALLPEILPHLDETFLAVLGANLQAAEQAGRRDAVERLNAIRNAVLSALSEAAPPEIRFINELLAQESDEEAASYIRSRSAELNQQYFDAMTYVAEDLRQNGQSGTARRVEKLQDLVMREAMAAKLRS